MASKFAAFCAAMVGAPHRSRVGNFYSSMHVWVRGTDGSLRRGDLSPGVTVRVADLAVAAASATHYESDLSLRCIRRTTATGAAPALERAITTYSVAFPLASKNHQCHLLPNAMAFCGGAREGA